MISEGTRGFRSCPVLRFVCSSSPLINGPSKVSDIISHCEGSWNSALLHSVFSLAEVEAISKIPIGSLGGEDFLVWHWTKNGEFKAAVVLPIRSLLVAPLPTI